MKPKARAKRRTYCGQLRKKQTSPRKVAAYWERRLGEEQPIAGSSLAALEQKLSTLNSPPSP